MNKSYALVWNATQGCWRVASELTRRRGKAGRGRVLMTAGASLIGLAFAGLAHALPTGGRWSTARARSRPKASR